MFDTSNNLVPVIRLFEILEMFYPPKGAPKAEPKVVQLFLLMFYFCARKRILDFKFANYFLLFRDLENVLSPGGRLRMQLPRGPIEYSFHFIGVGNPTGVSNLLAEIRH